jgi:hypothetical protein
MRGAALAAMLALSVAARAGAPPEGARVAWDYHVVVDAAAGVARVEIALRGFPGTRVCADMGGAGRFAREVEQRDAGGAFHALSRDRDVEDCFDLLAPSVSGAIGGALALRYRMDLGAMSGGRGDPDYSAHAGAGFVFNSDAVLLRPDPLPDDAAITVEIVPPPGMQVATPWRALGGQRFALDSEQFDDGAYVAVTKLHELGDVNVRGGGGGGARVHVIDVPRKADDDTLRGWVRGALQSVADFYGEVPGGRVHVLLMPVRGADESGVFGTVLRRGLPSVMLLFGADAEPAAFAHDWVARHELFHLGNPRTAGRLAWFIEGFTTYYEEVLGTRAGAYGVREATEVFANRFDEECQPRRGVSLRKESANLRHYPRVYWGGACLAFRVDAALRAHGRTLDEVMRALRRGSDDLDEDAVVAALDRACGAPVAKTALDATKPIALPPPAEFAAVLARILAAPPPSVGGR